MTDENRSALEIARALAGVPPEDADAVYEADLAALPRIGTSPIATKAEMTKRIEQLAFDLARQRETRHAAGEADWWRFADMLDDVMDILDALKGTAERPPVVPNS